MCGRFTKNYTVLQRAALRSLPLAGERARTSVQFVRAVAKIDFGIIAWMPLVPSTTCVT